MQEVMEDDSTKMEERVSKISLDKILPAETIASSPAPVAGAKLAIESADQLPN